jgi:hypothetical protein
MRRTGATCARQQRCVHLIAHPMQHRGRHAAPKLQACAVHVLDVHGAALCCRTRDMLLLGQRQSQYVIAAYLTTKYVDEPRAMCCSVSFSQGGVGGVNLGGRSSSKRRSNSSGTSREAGASQVGNNLLLHRPHTLAAVPLLSTGRVQGGRSCSLGEQSCRMCSRCDALQAMFAAAPASHGSSCTWPKEHVLHCCMSCRALPTPAAAGSPHSSKASSTVDRRCQLLTSRCDVCSDRQLGLVG